MKLNKDEYIYCHVMQALSSLFPLVIVPSKMGNMWFLAKSLMVRLPHFQVGLDSPNCYDHGMEFEEGFVISK